MTTLHILSSPYSPVNTHNRMDPFSIITWKFIHYMSKLGWHCVHYGIPGSSVDCENVSCLDSISPDIDYNVLRYNENASLEIAKRKKPGDMLICCYGAANKIAADQHLDLKAVEPIIGYATNVVFAHHRVFTSYAHMHMFYGERGMMMTPSWFDAVIPNAISADEFDYTESKEDYFLYFGRVIDTKGVHIAIQATEAAGKKLIIAGPGLITDLGYPGVPRHVEMVGLCNAEQRRVLMKSARAIIGPTHYVEPFGNMVPEGYMSGTPAITTDWGGFTETVINGVTGYRCREFKEFVRAIENIDLIDPKNCRKWAMENCEDTVVHNKFDQYLKRIAQLDFYRL